MVGKANLIDFVRCWLVIGMILIHIVHFNDVYPAVKEWVYALTMPPFLMLCGLLMNVEHEPRKFFKNWGQWAGLYAVMELCFAVASYFLSVRDGLAQLSLPSLLRAVFVSPVGVYWFLHTMLLCQLVHYLACHWLGRRGLPLTCLVVWLLVQFTPLLWNIAFSFVLGVFFRYGGAQKLLSRCSWRWIDIKAVQYVGRNTLPIYIFHPLFTMASRYYEPLFVWDGTALAFTVVTVALCIAGSLSVAWLLEKTRLSLLFFRPRLLR